MKEGNKLQLKTFNFGEDEGKFTKVYDFMAFNIFNSEGADAQVVDVFVKIKVGKHQDAQSQTG